jgi:Uma2 family endonuclease
VLSASTEAFDRDQKMAIYAREGVKHAWLVDPIAQTVEVFVLDARRWGPPST